MHCKICKKPVKNIKSLSTHIQFKHENNKKKYYDEFMLFKGGDKCKICGDPTDFYLLQYGYKKYCSKLCAKIDKKKHMKENNPMKKNGAKINQRETNQKRYGINQNTQRNEIKEKIKETNLKKYGVDNVIKVKSIADKAKKSREKTCLREHGVASYFLVDSIKEKAKKTMIKKYGVENPLQNPAIFKKAQKTAKTLHYYNENLYYRGSFEKDFLDRFANKFDIKQGLSFKYIINERNRTYHSDFYIPNLNLIIEIKNSYLFEKYYESIKAKELSVKKLKYNYIIIIDKNYEEFKIKWSR